MALLHVAWRWSKLAGVPIEAVTVNHGLRAEAVDEAAMVSSICADLGIPHTTLHWDGKAARGNLAAAGREARYRLMGEWAQERGILGVLVGHNVDDIAETFLMRLARKSGVDGLAMMRPTFRRDGIEWARPFWHHERAELRDYLRRHDVRWIEDPTNEDDSYERPKARKVLAELAPLGITVDTLMSVATLQSDARYTLEHYTRQEAERVVTQEQGDIVIERRVYPPVPLEIERRLLVAAFKSVGQADHPPRNEAMLDLEIGLGTSGKHTLAGCIVTQDKHHTRIARELNAVKDLSCPSDHIWDNRWAIDGPHAPNLTIRALGESLKDVPDWREIGLPRSSLIASPAV
ncbi:UNVERIFIED_CONTAM: hypothetical protein GTU68_007519, partial [Idotea baltica]|nr:hypothetical protein [Idotea baltica]